MTLPEQIAFKKNTTLLEMDWRIWTFLAWDCVHGKEINMSKLFPAKGPENKLTYKLTPEHIRATPTTKSNQNANSNRHSNNSSSNSSNSSNNSNSNSTNHNKNKNNNKDKHNKTTIQEQRRPQQKVATIPSTTAIAMATTNSPAIATTATPAATTTARIIFETVFKKLTNSLAKKCNICKSWTKHVLALCLRCCQLRPALL